jgi:PAS domain S-box-containing protein
MQPEMTQSFTSLECSSPEFAAAHLSAIFESTPDPLWSVDLDFVLVKFNHAFVRYFETARGIRPEIGMTIAQLVEPGREAFWISNYEKVLAKGQHDFEIQAPDRRCFEASANLIVESGQPAGISVFLKDITERRNVEQELRIAEQKYRAIFEQAPEGIFHCSADGKSAVLNPSAAEILGYESHATPLDQLLNAAEIAWYNPSDRRRYLELLERHGRIRDPRCCLKRKDGTPVMVSLDARAVYSPQGEFAYYQGFIGDITERDRMEEELKEKVRELEVLRGMDLTLLQASTETELLRGYCKILVESGGFDIAWVGFAEDSEEENMVAVASFGDGAGLLEVVDSWAGTAYREAASRKAIRSGQVQVVKNISEQTGANDWQMLLLKSGYCSAISVPFEMEDGARACLTAYKKCPPYSAGFEKRLVEQVAAQLGFGIATLRTAHAKDRFQEQLRTSLEQTIGIISETIDARDPYTAGHQLRVADVCTKIATQLGLSPERVRGLHLAATIHDCGKIAIPSELLVKPGRLTPAEYSLLKEHAQRGYDIVKKIEFPWPIAEMILQHHERMDGSGYPRGLRGEQILLESRILAVADVIDAMSGHRPYRPAQGIDAAVKEIRKGRGISYDSDVADAALCLFADQLQTSAA